jgi:hypothetical protein
MKRGDVPAFVDEELDEIDSDETGATGHECGLGHCALSFAERQ